MMGEDEMSVSFNDYFLLDTRNNLSQKLVTNFVRHALKNTPFSIKGSYHPQHSDVIIELNKTGWEESWNKEEYGPAPLFGYIRASSHAGNKVTFEVELFNENEAEEEGDVMGYASYEWEFKEYILEIKNLLKDNFIKFEELHKKETQNALYRGLDSTRHSYSHDSFGWDKIVGMYLRHPK